MFSQLEARRKQLRMSMPALAQRSGVSLPTVRRILADESSGASFQNVIAIAEALGLSASFEPKAGEQEICEQQARSKARELVNMVQATCGLESQAVDDAELEVMIERTARELLAGSRRRLWAA